LGGSWFEVNLGPKKFVSPQWKKLGMGAHSSHPRHISKLQSENG
jgi:hypothetical protein